MGRIEIPWKFRQAGGAWVKERDLEKLEKIYANGGYGYPKYLLFIRYLFDQRKYRMKLDAAQSTRSKYVTVHYLGMQYKIRWSDHVPNEELEREGACDFYVGRTNLGVTTTRQAYYAMLRYFEEGESEKDRQESS